MSARAALRTGLAALLAALAWGTWLGAPAADSGTVYVTRVEDEINAGTAAHLEDSLAQCEREGCLALVVELDTPGGIIDDTKKMVSAILNAPVPVIVYVAPRGAWAGSAGTFITLAGHVAAMAPSTTIGAAHPVMSDGSDPGGPMPPPPPGAPGTPTDPNAPKQPGWRQNFSGQKIENFMAAYAESIARERGRNVEFAAQAVRESIAISGPEAVQKKVVDLVAEDLEALLEAIDGREVKVSGKPVVLATASARIQRIDMTLSHRVIQFLASPTIASLLLLGGILGLYAEFSAPGGFVFGVLGAACLLLAAFGLGYLPFSSFGLVLMLAGVALMVAELFLPAFGLVFFAGVVCLGLGAYMLFDVPEMGDVSVPFWTTIFPSVVVVALLGAGVVYAVSQTIFHPVFAGSGADGVVGQIAVADQVIEPSGRGRVKLQGELWNAESAERIEAGERVRIEEVRDLVVRVTRIGGETKT